MHPCGFVRYRPLPCSVQWRGGWRGVPPRDGYGGNDTSSSADTIFGSVPKRDIWEYSHAMDLVQLRTE